MRSLPQPLARCLSSALILLCLILAAFLISPAFTGLASAPANPPAQLEETILPIGPVEEPEERQDGDGVSIKGVEPSKIESATGGVISVYGSGFEAGSVVRLIGYGLLDSTVVNGAAIKAMIPPGLAKGNYDIQVILPDNRSAILNGAVKIYFPKGATPTPTTKPGAFIYGQPQLVIQSAQTEPEVVQPGSPFTLTLQLGNRGDYTATNIRVSLAASDVAIPRQGSSLVVIDKLAQGTSTTVSMLLALNTSATTGFRSLDLNVEYSDYMARAFASKQSVGFEVSTNLAEQPLILLNSYRTEPQAISPGDNFTLFLEISNVGKTDAQQLILTLGGLDGAGLKPFAIIGSGNVMFIPAISAGSTTQIEQKFTLDGDAESGMYNLPVILGYEGVTMARKEETQVLNLLVTRRPQFRVSFYRAVEPGLVDQEMTLPIELVNISRTLINVSTVEISGADLEIVNGTGFVGALDGGTTGSLDAVVIPKKSGSLSVEVQVNYLDDFNQAQSITETLSFQVLEPTPTPAAGSQAEAENGEPSLGDRILSILKGLFGLGS